MTTVNGQVDPADHIIATMPAALPSDWKEGDTAMASQATTEIRRVLRKLSAATPSFHSTGYCDIPVTTEGVTEIIGLPIQTIPYTENLKLLADGFIPPPMKSTLDQKTMLYVDVPDENNPDYLKAKILEEFRYQARAALRNLAMDIEDDDGRIVWEWNGTIRDEDAALQMLEKKFTTQHIQQIRNAAEALGVRQQRIAEVEQQKKPS